jgi:hypothetical protein
MIAKLILAFLLIIPFSLVILMKIKGNNSIQAVTEPIVEKKLEDKSKFFCNGLNLPKERQCPTMNDL